MKRFAYFDNAKLLLIYLVVFGHMIQPFIESSQGMNTLYMWVYTFHMPAFIFLAGFFAKGSKTWQHFIHLGKKLLIPYIIFQVLYSTYFYFIGKSNWQTSLFYPHWSLWFLLSLLSWHILLHWFKRLPPAIGIFLSVQIGLTVGYIGDIGHMYSLSRTFVFFPFFLVGYWVTKDHVMFLKRHSVKILSLAMMAIIAVGIYIAPEFNSGWLLASKSYDDLGLPYLGGFARTFVYLTSAMMGLGFLAWVPTKRFIWTKLGERTLYVYLLHGFFIQFFREKGLFSAQSVFEVMGLAILSAIIVWLLSSRPIRMVSQPMIEGHMSILRERWRESSVK